MIEQPEGRKLIYIEKMDGFSSIIHDLNSIYECDFIYDHIKAIGTSGTPSEIIGIIKGPRIKLNTDILYRIAEAMSDPVIGYIGRHPEKILDEGVVYTRQNIDGVPILLIQAGQKEIPLLSIEESPLSEAVARYVSGMVNAILKGRLKEIEKLTIPGGNNFDQRLNHSFDIESHPDFKDVTLGIIGAGEIGVKVMHEFSRNGANIFYTDYLEKPLPTILNSTYFPQIKSILHRPHDARSSYVVSLHLPKEVKISLADASGIDILVNTSSGSNIDEDELMTAIKEGRIGHAILDVFKHEGQAFSNDKINQYIGDGHLTVTPHIAYNNLQAIHKVLRITIDNIINFRNKRKELSKKT